MGDFRSITTHTKGDPAYDQLIIHRDKDCDKDMILHVRTVDLADYSHGYIVRRKNGAALVDEMVDQKDKRSLDLDMVSSLFNFDKDEDNIEDNVNHVNANQFARNDTTVLAVGRDTMSEHEFLPNRRALPNKKEWSNKYDELRDGTFKSQRPD